MQGKTILKLQYSRGILKINAIQQYSRIQTDCYTAIYPNISNAVQQYVGLGQPAIQRYPYAWITAIQRYQSVGVTLFSSRRNQVRMLYSIMQHQGNAIQQQNRAGQDAIQHYATLGERYIAVDKSRSGCYRAIGKGARVAIQRYDRIDTTLYSDIITAKYRNIALN